MYKLYTATIQIDFNTWDQLVDYVHTLKENYWWSKEEAKSTYKVHQPINELERMIMSIGAELGCCDHQRKNNNVPFHLIKMMVASIVERRLNENS